MPDCADGPGPAQVDRVGPFEALILYSTAVTLCLSGPVLLAFTFFADLDFLLGGVLCTVLCTPLGLAIWFHAQRERENNRRLDAVGIAVTAEVTSLTDWDDGESTGVAAGLRISGPGVQTFETTWRHSSPPALRVGLLLPVVVDPARSLFRLEL
ncbi:hypothetical protein OG241_01645 [Streptomyces sp. NBC_01390]|uniref:hypothetical protein n=1 Tax=Streptomyces sp. NBC_01390 TaxID=2903850 RepID=UPI00324E16FF